MRHTSKSVSQVEYLRIIESVMYLMTCTRSNIAHDVGVLSRCTSTLSIDHWNRVIRLFKYLRYTRTYSMYYKIYSIGIEGYSDAN